VALDEKQRKGTWQEDSKQKKETQSRLRLYFGRGEKENLGNLVTSREEEKR